MPRKRTTWRATTRQEHMRRARLHLKEAWNQIVLGSIGLLTIGLAIAAGQAIKIFIFHK